MKILQVGLGNFGRNHLKAWAELGLTGDLYLADLATTEAAREWARYNLPADRVVADYRKILDRVDVVDVVTPSDSHYAICREALARGKDVFVEKPMVMTSEEAVALAHDVQQGRRILQVGYYYRFHPISALAKEAVDGGRLGELRYLSGRFMGFKRPRRDVGVTHTDGIHFLDLFNWLLGSHPREVYAVTRDHFGRGLEDFSMVICHYPGGQVATVESGYIQPGQWKDKVVPNALTTKEIAVVGSRATLEVDFEIERVTLHDVHHELKEGAWAVVHGGATTPLLPPASPVDQIGQELRAFLRSVETRQEPGANVVDSGLMLASLMEAIYASARARTEVTVPYPNSKRG